MRLIVLACMMLHLMGLGANKAFAAEYFVRVSGDDTNPGVSATQAFATVTRAAQVAASGDTIYVGGGTYGDAVTIDGILGSTDVTTFVADPLGTKTGDAGYVVISGSLAVVNCNYVGFHGFTFRGATRPLVWKGAYEGRFEDCVFDEGAEPLLIKDGHVTFDQCEITDFAGDGIYVDGEAFVTVSASTISGCGGEGIEISKTARVVVTGTTIEENTGDGIKVEHLAGTIDDGGAGAAPLPTGPRLVVGRDAILASGGAFDSYDSGLGAYGPGNTGSDADLYTNNTVTLGAAVPVYGDVYYGPSGSASAPNLTGSVIQMPREISLDPIDPGDAATNNNNASIPNTDLGINPLSGGNLTVPSGHVLTLPAGTYYLNKLALTGGTIQLSGPTTFYVVSDVNSSGGTIINPSGKPIDCKILVMGPSVNFKGTSPVQAAIYAPDARITITGSVELFGMAVGDEIVMSGQAIHADVSLTGYAFGLQGGNGNSEPTPPSSWSAIATADLEVNDSTVNDNSRGIHMETAQSLKSVDSVYNSNLEWGLSLRGTCDLADCTVNGNGIGGLWLTAYQDGDFKFVDLGLSDNVDYGIYLDDCDVTFDSSSLNPALISGSDHVVAMSGGKLTLNGLTFRGGAVAGVLASGGVLSAQNTTFTDNGYGLGVSGSAGLSLDTCSVSGNTVGLYLHENASVYVADSELKNNSAWASIIYASSVASANVTFDGCDLHDNDNGVTLINGGTGDLTLVDSAIRDNNKKGLQFINGNLTFGDQATNNWQVVRNNYNISSVKSTLTLNGVTVEDSTSYGVLAIDSLLTLSGCTIVAPHGIFADGANQGLTIDATRIVASGVPGWGVVRYGGDVTIRNTVIGGFWGGVFLTTTAAADDATVVNATIANAAAFGVYAMEGDATVQNSILTGDGTGVGLMKANKATLAHSYNLLHDFSKPFEGTVADATELLKSPRFVDAVGGDFHLAVGSPAINIGLDLGGQVANDLDGNARPSFKAFEVGAYEYVDPHGSFRVLEWSETK